VAAMGLDQIPNMYDSVLANIATEDATRVSRDFASLDMAAMTDKHDRLEFINTIKHCTPFSTFSILLHKLSKFSLVFLVIFYILWLT
jgi:hypothetical protein